MSKKPEEGRRKSASISLRFVSFNDDPLSRVFPQNMSLPLHPQSIAKILVLPLSSFASILSVSSKFEKDATSLPRSTSFPPPPSFSSLTTSLASPSRQSLPTLRLTEYACWYLSFVPSNGSRPRGPRRSNTASFIALRSSAHVGSFQVPGSRRSSRRLQTKARERVRGSVKLPIL